MVNKKGDYQTRVLLPSDLLLQEEQLLSLVSCCEVTACHSGPDSHTFLEKLWCWLSALRAEKKYATRPTFIPGSYFLLGFFVSFVLGGCDFNLSLKLGNNCHVFVYPYKGFLHFVLILKRDSVRQSSEGFDGLQWDYGIVRHVCQQMRE